jgi:hypothetical protein
MEMLGSIAAPVIGGLLGSGGTKQSQSVTNSIDPRYGEYLYGAGGLLPSAANWYAQNKSGMNDQMAQGLNSQWNTLQQSQPGYMQMQNLGLGLMGGGVAGNPFSWQGSSSPYAMPQGYQPTAQQGPFVNRPAPVQAPVQQAPQNTMPTPGSPEFINMMNTMTGWNGGGA